MSQTRNSKVGKSKIPHERTRFEAIVELLYSGAWLQAHTVYDDFAEEPGKDVKDFVSAQTNIAVLAALMLTILAAMLFEFANKPTVIGCLLTILIWGSAALYFVACTFSVFLIMCLSQADTDEEADALLMNFGSLTVQPVRQWVYASLTLAMAVVAFFVDAYLTAASNWVSNEQNSTWQWQEESPTASILALILCVLIVLLIAVYLIVRVSDMILIVYQSKRDFKHRMLAYTEGGDTLEKQFQEWEIVISMADIDEDLRAFSQQVGDEYVRYDMFQRLLYAKYSTDDGGEHRNYGLQRFATLTTRRIEAVFNRYLDGILQAELKSLDPAPAPAPLAAREPIAAPAKVLSCPQLAEFDA